MRALKTILVVTLLAWSQLGMAVSPSSDKFAVEVEPDKSNGNKMHLSIFHAPEEVKISITDASGKEFYKEKLKASEPNLTQMISLEHLKPGIYYVTVISGKHLYKQSYAVE